MDVNQVLLWSVVMAWALGLSRVVRAARLGQPGWLVVYGALLALAGAGLTLFPSHVGSVCAGAFALLIVLPSLLQRRLWLLMGAQRYPEARKVADALRVLHPADGLRELPTLIDGLAAGQRGDVARAEQLLTQVIASSPPLAPQARVHLYRIRGDWQGYLDTTSTLGAAELQRDLAQHNSRLRALGETGQPEALMQSYAQHAALLQLPESAMLRVYAQLFVASFCGRSDALERLLTGTLAFLGPATHRYWRATCAYAQGEPERGAALLEPLLTHPEGGVAEGARQRLARPPVHAEPLLSDESRALLDALPLQIDQELRFGDGARSQAPILTRTLIGLNLLAFAGEVALGGSENPLALYQMGALLSGSLSADDAWRLLMALFLHLGPLHLGMNMLALSALGPFVEGSLGKARTLAVYLASGLIGSLLIASLPDDAPGLFLGASGCIMGLLGAMAAILLHGYLRERARPALDRLWRVAFILVLQLAFDLNVKIVSATAHWSGIALGFVLTFALVAARRR